MTLIATAALSTAVLFRSLPDNRMLVCIIVSIAAVMLAVRSLFTGKIVWALLFPLVLGVFTPFRSSQFSYVLSSIIDLATLALFAASPTMLRKWAMPTVSNQPPGTL